MKKENPWMSLLFGVVLPSLILSKLSSPERLGPALALPLALSFPLGYGVYDLLKNRKWNWIAVLGIVNTLFTGGLAFFSLDHFWFAVKEATFPFLIGLFVLIFAKSKSSLAHKIFLNDQILHVDELKKSIEEKQKHIEFNKLLQKTNYVVAFSFFLSASLNFALAQILLKSPTGTEAFNEELGKMTALSFPVIALPCTLILFGSFFYFLHSVKKITGQGTDVFFKKKVE